MLAPAKPSGPSLVSADPGALDRFAAAGGRTRGVEAASAAVDRAVAVWNGAACDPRYQVQLEPFGAQIQQLAGNWTLGDNFAARVAAAFRRADAGGGTVRYATQHAVDRGMRDNASYNPIASLGKGDRALWARLVGDRCYAGGGRYLGGGFIIGPDGRRYPLVIPQVGHGGKTYNADDGGTGNVATLDGADPGWFQTAIYTSNRALFATDTRDAVVGAVLIALTGGTAPSGNAASPADYNGLVLGDGRPRWYAHGVAPGRTVDPRKLAGLGRLDEPKGPGPNGRQAAGPSLTRGSAGGAAALFPLAAVEQAATVASAERNGHYGAYQLRLERNLDGRVRARLTIYSIKKNADGSRVIAPLGISVGDHGVNGQIIHYRPHVEPRQPHAEPRSDGTYHIFDHLTENSGFFADPNQPYTDAYQDR